MKNLLKLSFLILVLLLAVSSCKKDAVHVVDFTKYTVTNNECAVVSVADTNQWRNLVLNRAEDTSLLIFADTIITYDSAAAVISLSPACPNPSNGFFIWQLEASRQCKMKLVCISTAGDILYYNAYGLNGGPMTIGFDFRNISTFKSGSNYRLYYGFYTSRDSLFYSGHGDIHIQ